MADALIIIAALVLVACGLLLALFARWVSRSWTVLEDDHPTERESKGALWSWLLGRAGRGPRRLTYRRDERGRFRRHRR